MRTYSDVREADPIAEALTTEGVTVEMEDGAVVPQIVQFRATGWDFMRQRIAALGLVADCAGGKLRIFAPDPGQEPVAVLTYGADIHRMDLELDGEAALEAVHASAWSAADQAVLRAEADGGASPADAGTPGLAGVGGATGVLHAAGARDQAALDALAAAHLLRARQAAIRGVVEVQGTAQAVPGDVVELAGMGRRFNARVLVRGIRHAIGRGDWMTSVEVGLEAPRGRERPSEAQIPPVSGLQIGVVSALEGDPSVEDRIEVRLTAVPATDGLVWARIAACDAGPGQGAVFRPDIGSEVVLGFLGDDTRDPVVLGALHSSARAAPIAAADDNDVKGYVSRAGTALQFDDSAPRVTLETRGGGRLPIDNGGGKVTLEDQNGNALTMEAGGIVLEASANMTLKAGGKLKIEGRPAVRSGDVTAHGGTVIGGLPTVMIGG